MPDPHVFVSYSSKDRPAADAVLAALEASGARCWIAPRDIQPGRDWGESIVEAIEGSRVMVLVFSGNANASPQVRREVERAVNKGVTIVPFRIENVAPCKSLEYFISVGHWLDAYAAPLEPHLARLGSTVAALSRAGGGDADAGGGGLAGMAGRPPADVIATAERMFRRQSPATPVTPDRSRPLRGRWRVGPAAGGLVAVGAIAAAAVAYRDGRLPLTVQVGRAEALPADADALDPPPASPATSASPGDLPGGWVVAKERPAATPLRSVSEILRTGGASEVTSLHLTTVALIGKQRFCVIDGTTLREGESVCGFAVEQIQSDRVIVARGGLRFELRPDPKPASGGSGGGGLLPPEILFGAPPGPPGGGGTWSAPPRRDGERSGPPPGPGPGPASGHRPGGR
jgi:hypothetical protein